MKPGFGKRVPPVDASVATQFERMGAIRSVPATDALLAATAMVEGLALVTGSLADVAGLDAGVLDLCEA